MPTKTIMTNVTDVLFTVPSVSNISFTDTTTTTAGTNITWLQDEGMTMSATYTFTPSGFHPEWNCKPDNLNDFLIGVNPYIVNIDIIVPDKVVEVTIYDGATHIYKQVCREPDDFDLTFALALAWTKYKNEVFNLDYTLEGIEDAAHEYMWKYKKPLKEFNRAIKAYNKWFKEETRKEVEEEERQAIIERRRAKNKKRKEKMKARKKQEEINTIAEAIKKAREN